MCVVAALGANCRRTLPHEQDAGLDAAAGARAGSAVVTVTATHVGLASCYAPNLAGRSTSSGEPYDPTRLTAAHRTLALGTRVRVTRIDHAGRPLSGPVVVTVNDRGPYEEHRLIDLSERAARDLGLWGTIARVRLEILR